MSTESVRARLERMENKMDKMADAIVALARVEERIVGIEQNAALVMKQIVAIDSRMNESEKRQIHLELEQVKDANVLAGLKKFFWLLVSAILGGAFLVWFTPRATKHQIQSDRSEAVQHESAVTTK